MAGLDMSVSNASTVSTTPPGTAAATNPPITTPSGTCLSSLLRQCSPFLVS